MTMNGKTGRIDVVNPVGGPGAYDAGVLEFFTGVHSGLDFTNEDANLVLTDNGAPVGGGVTFPIGFTGALTTDVMESSKVAGDAFNRYERRADGSERWGNGAAATDTPLARTSVGNLTLGDPAGASIQFGARPGVSGGDVYLQSVDALSSAEMSGESASLTLTTASAFLSLGVVGANALGGFGDLVMATNIADAEAYLATATNVYPITEVTTSGITFFGPNAAERGSYTDGGFAFGEGGAGTVAAVSGGPGIFRILFAGGGVQIDNDDSSQRKAIKLSHDGTTLELV